MTGREEHKKKAHEPCNLREWSVQMGRLFTCGRPGRGCYPSSPRKWPAVVPDTVLAAWVGGLPPIDPLHIVSLLGRKPPPGPSEFASYPFRSEHETASKPTFQEWLRQKYGARFEVHEFPTIDTEKIPAACLDAITGCVATLVAAGEAVVIVDSAGQSRTGCVCRTLGLREAPPGSPCV